MTEQHFSVQSGEAAYEITALLRQGSAGWVMCLHGIQSNKALFRDLAAQPFLDGYSIVVPDFVGFGDSSKPEDFSYDIADQANICIDLAKQLGIDSVTLIGHSLGGMVATLMLKELGYKANGIINLEGNFFPEDAGASKVIAGQSFGHFRAKGYEKLKAAIEASGEKSASTRLAWLATTPDYAIYKTAQSIIKWSETGELMRLFANSPARKLYIFGDQNTDKAARLPANVARAAIPNAGHFMLLEQPAQTFGSIANFLQ